ncbi:MAG: hypothetical protein MUE94_12680 [Verrucomicrobia bacterium]|nr:hypothetical protein [Verrucomicrobiota bacterium]
MSTVQEIKDAIQTLSAAELAEIEDWFREQHPRLASEEMREIGERIIRDKRGK